MNITSSFYDSALENDITYAAEFGPSSQTRYRIIARLFRKFKFSSSKVLEAGASTGDLSLYMIKKLKLSTITVTDYSSVSINQMKKKGLKLAFQADLTKPNQVEKEKYKTIICSEVLEHIKEDNKVLTNLYAALEKRGKVIISSPYLMNKWSKTDEVSGHVRRYEKGELEKKIKQVGFKIDYTYVWGAFFYNFYYALLSKSDSMPTILAKKPSIWKRILMKIIFYILYLDDLLVFTRKGRTIFIVAHK